MDPLLGAGHVYAYALNNPLRYFDPLGLDADPSEEQKKRFLQGMMAQTAYNALWWSPLVGFPRVQEIFTAHEDETFARTLGGHAGNMVSIAGGAMVAGGGATVIEAGLGLMAGGAAAELVTAGGGTARVVVVAGGAVVVVGGAIVAEGAFTALSSAVGEAHMLRAAFSAWKRPQSWSDCGDAPDPGRLGKLTRNEVRKHGLEPLKQEESVPAPPDPHKDPFTGQVGYQVEGGPFQYLTDVPELKTR